MMDRRKGAFKRFYLIYLAVLVVLVISGIWYVRSLLRVYEAAQPETHLKKVTEKLAEDAAAGTLWSEYVIPEMVPGKYEGTDLKERYLSCYRDKQVSFSKMPGRHEEDELYYYVENGTFPLAEVKLKARGPLVTRLAIFSYREWEVEYVRPIFEAREYSITVPAEFGVKVNGIALAREDGVLSADGEISFTLSGIYLEPAIEIADSAGNQVAYAIKEYRVIPQIGRYSLTLPEAFTVEVDGAVHEGEAAGDGLLRHDIWFTTKPAVRIYDRYGNSVDYEGGDKLPVTYMTITAMEDYSVSVAGKPVPEEDISAFSNSEHAVLAGYVPVPVRTMVYDIAVLGEDAEVSVTDGQGSPVALEPGQTSYDFTARQGLAEVPASVQAEVDVLDVVQKWSLFMSRDLELAQLKPYLVRGSDLYQAASRYAGSVDITFTSAHTLLNPAFTDAIATNFVWITDKCFSVDVSFVKHMNLTKSNMQVDDAMNDRCYFIKYDDTSDNVENPTWKLVSMKEIIDEE